MVNLRYRAPLMDEKLKMGSMFTSVVAMEEEEEVEKYRRRDRLRKMTLSSMEE